MSQDRPSVLTRAEARAWFDASGMTINEWARANGFEPALVYSMLSGRLRGHRGQAHRVAVALGIKLPPAHVSLGQRPQPDNRKALTP